MHKNGTGRRAYYMRCRPNMSPLQVLRAIARAAGISPIGDTDRVLRALRYAFGARTVLIVLDEAQHLSVVCFETVRELLDEPPHCGLLFMGSHELQRIFTINAVALEQWNSRFYGGYTLGGITEEEAAQIVGRELPGAKAAAIKALVSGARTPHLRNPRETYISARRLFHALDELKAPQLAEQEVVNA